MAKIAPYIMAMCRPRMNTAFDEAGSVRREVLDANIDHFCELIAQAASTHHARIVAFPQFALTGYTPLGGPGWAEASLTVPGPEIERIASAARAAQAYVVVQLAERHAAFPGRYFLSAAILTPQGEVGIVHRKNYAMSLRTSPIDVYDRFIETFGADAFFPVLDTPLGAIGLAIGAEVHWPEPVRALALKGAEIVINPVAAAPLIDYLKRPGAEAVRGVRAFENVAYLGMANISAEGSPPSAIYDYNGAPVGRETDDGLFTLAEVDIEALRKARSAPAANFLAQIQPAIHEPLDALPLWPRNAFADSPPSDAGALIQLEADTWARLQELGRGRGLSGT